MCPKPRRMVAWARLASDLDADKLASLTTTVPFEAALDSARSILEGAIRGRVVVEIG